MQEGKSSGYATGGENVAILWFESKIQMTIEYLHHRIDYSNICVCVYMDVFKLRK